MTFVKRTAVWATVWWAIILAIATFNDLRNGTFAFGQFVGAAVGIWIFFFVAVAAAKAVFAVRLFGGRLGQEVVSNPRQGAGDAIRRAAGGQHGPARRG